MVALQTQQREVPALVRGDAPRGDAAADAGPSTASAERIVDGVLSELARNAGSPAAYEILLLQPPEAPITGPERATNLISPASVPPRLRTALGVEGSQQWTNTSAVYVVMPMRV